MSRQRRNIQIHHNKLAWSTITLAIAWFASACAGLSAPAATPTPGSAEPIIGRATGTPATSPTSLATGSGKVLLNGAGAGAPLLLYQKYFEEYSKLDPTVKFTYQSVGSGVGKSQIMARAVLFGASDSALSDEELNQAPGLLQFPSALGAVALIYNLPGVDKSLNLSSDAIAGIYLGTITKWNDPKISADNPGLNLPDAGIAVTYISNASGTADNFTYYLNQVSPDWKLKVGNGLTVTWPVGTGGSSNGGVTAIVKQKPNSIGFVDLSFALQNKVTYANVKNPAGKFVTPSLETTTAAAADKRFPVDLRFRLTNEAGDNAYSISSQTFLLTYVNIPDQAQGTALVKFLWWIIHDGQKINPTLGYAPLASSLVKLCEGKIRSIEIAGKENVVELK